MVNWTNRRLALPMTRRPLRRFLLLARGQHPAHDWRVQLVLAFTDITAVVFHSQDENWQISLLIEILMRHCYRQYAVKAMFAVSGLVAMLLDVPSEDANLIVVVGQTVVRFSDRA